MKVKPRYKKGDRIGGRYLVHQALMGGMGEVYLCLDEQAIYPFALKTFQQRYLAHSQRLRHAFEQEVLVWVGLEKHPNIVRCFHMDTLDNQPFMVLEWIAGEEGKEADLRGWLRQGPLELKTALDFAIDICRGLVYAQEKQPGIVHRDLKPENILVAQGGLAKITDFGLAQIVVQANLEVNGLPTPDGAAMTSPQQSLAARGGVVGTPPYMPPEQWQPNAVLDERADIYALGCVLYEMLTGQLPFTVDILPTTDETYRRWLHAWQWQHEHADRLALSGAIPAPLVGLLTSCLAPERIGRPASVADLLAVLQQVYARSLGQATRSGPVSTAFSSDDYSIRAHTYAVLGRHEEALADYEQAIRLNPANATAFYNRGLMYQNLGHYKEALADYDQAIRLNPAFPSSYKNRGLTYHILGRYEEALADYEQTIRLDPAHADALYNRGNTYHTLGRYEEALADYEQAIGLDPAYADAYDNRGATYAALGRSKEALADYEQAIRLNPADAKVYNNRGTTYADLGHYDEALADYAQAIRLNPAYADALYNRGNTYQNLGRYEPALADYQQAIRLNPADAKVYNNRGNTYADLGRYGEALADYAQALRLNPADAQAYNNRGNTYQKLGQYEEALADYQQAIRLNPAYAEAYNNRGSMCNELRRYDEALADYAQALRLNAAFATVYINRGTTYNDLGRYDEALVDYQQAIRLNPTYAEAYFNCGVLLANTGRLRESLPYFEKAAQLGLAQAVQAFAQIKQMLG